jgi:hypothetical protein
VPGETELGGRFRRQAIGKSAARKSVCGVPPRGFSSNERLVTKQRSASGVSQAPIIAPVDFMNFTVSENALTINRSDLEQTMIRAKMLEAQIADGTAKTRRRKRAAETRGDDGRL